MQYLAIDFDHIVQAPSNIRVRILCEGIYEIFGKSEDIAKWESVQHGTPVDVDIVKDVQRTQIIESFEKEIAQSEGVDVTPQREIDTFFVQEVEAKSLLENNNDNPMLDAIMEFSPCNSKHELALSIIKNARDYKITMGNCIGKKQMYFEAINDAQTCEEVRSITWEN